MHSIAEKSCSMTCSAVSCSVGRSKAWAGSARMDAVLHDTEVTHLLAGPHLVHLNCPWFASCSGRFRNRHSRRYRAWSAGADVLQEKTRMLSSSRWTGAVRSGTASAVMEVSVPQTAGWRWAGKASATARVQVPETLRQQPAGKLQEPSERRRPLPLPTRRGRARDVVRGINEQQPQQATVEDQIAHQVDPLAQPLHGHPVVGHTAPRRLRRASAEPTCGRWCGRCPFHRLRARRVCRTGPGGPAACGRGWSVGHWGETRRPLRWWGDAWWRGTAPSPRP